MKILKFLTVVLLFTIIPYYIGNEIIPAHIPNMWYVLYLVGLLAEFTVLFLILVFITVLMEVKVI